MIASLVVGTEVQCSISVIGRHLKLYIAQGRHDFDLGIEVKLSEGLVG